jgi:hypothetical protein
MRELRNGNLLNYNYLNHIYLFIYLFIYSFVCLFVCLFVCICFTPDSTEFWHKNFNPKNKKIMAFVDTEQKINETEISNTILEQVNTWKCLLCNVLY